MNTRLAPLALASAAAMAAASFEAAAAGSCRAESAAAPPQVVELYTSEGCSSCPPADRWLSTLKAQPGVLALAFHVNYWDQLGWPDRFATAEGTARQRELARDGSGVYTPQVRVNGNDWRRWPRLPAADAPRQPAPQVTLARDGGMVTAHVAPVNGHPGNLSGYWAVLEDRHVSAVRAGENAGETLRHDHVVRLYRPVAGWSASTGVQIQLQVSSGVAEFPRRVVFVVTDAQQRPVQAVALGC